jgi:hypothetical protein
MENEFNNIDERLLLEDERIAKYLKGKMTADEEQLFLQELGTNAELKEKAVAMARLAKAMKEVGIASDKDVVSEFLDVDSDTVKTVAKDAIVTKKKGKIITWRRTVTWLSAAASVALLVWGGFSFNDYRKTTGLGEEYSSVFTSSQFTRGGEDNAEVENKLAKLFDNVASKQDLDNTLHELSLCWQLATKETYNDYTDYAPEIGWNLAIGHLKNNDKKKAKEVLTKLIDITPEGTAIGDKARELLKKVEEL